MQQPYIRVLGLKSEGTGLIVLYLPFNSNTGRLNNRFKPEEEAQFGQMARRSDLYDYLTQSIAPAIWGYDGLSRCFFS